MYKKDQLQIDKLAKKTLGKNTGYPDRYDNSLLIAIPRHYNRASLNYNSDTLGFDNWRAFEVSCISNNNLPYFCIITISVPSNSYSIIESKSLKLYLNSLANMRFNSNGKQLENDLLNIIKTDLENILDHKINVRINNIKTEPKSLPLDEFLDISDIIKDDFKLQAIDNFSVKNINQSQNISSHFLKSRCRITDQPDWGNLFIEIEGKHGLDENSLASFLVKNHDLNHFHEEMCELIYCKILDEIKPQKLTVACLYTRRGGIDINPIRSNNKNSKLLKSMHDINYFKSTFRQ